MDFSSAKGLGCLAATVIVIGIGLTCPFMATISSNQKLMILETKEVTCAPGAEFDISTDFHGGEQQARNMYVFSPQGPKGGPVWSFDEANSDGVILGGNALSMRILAPTKPGTYNLTAKFPGLFGDKKHCKVVVTDSGGTTGPALGLVSIGVKEDGALTWKWTLAPVLEGCSTILLKDGSVLMAGGWAPDPQNGRMASSAALRYWPKERRAQSVGPLRRGRAEAESILLPDGRVLLVGGGDKPVQLSSSDPDVNEYVTDVEIFDPATNRFETASTLPMSCFDYRIASTPGGAVLLYPYLDLDRGRWNFELKKAPPPIAYLFNPKSGTLASIGPVPSLRERPTLTSLKDGRVLIVGAPVVDNDRFRNQPPASGAMVDYFVPDRNSFSAGSEMRFGRRDQSAVVLQSGKVLVFGGWMNNWSSPGGSGAILPERSEIFDPATGFFSEAEPLPYVLAHSGRGTRSATALPDGTALIIAAGELHRLLKGPNGNGAIVRVNDSLVGVRTVTLLSDGHALLLGNSANSTNIFYP